MDAASAERKLGRFLPKFFLASCLALLLAYLFGGLSDDSAPSLLQNFSRQFFILYTVLAPTFFIAYLLYIEVLRTRERKRIIAGNSKLIYHDAFELPSQDMHGYKIALITGREPTLTGLTGDTYKADDTAKCEMNREHVPPVADCDCGFYAYLDLRAAEHQLSINPGAFLIDVDLFGVGFAYSRGFRAESQLVNSMALPKRCMRCKVFRPEQFVRTFKLGFNSFAYWSWEIRCRMCSKSFKDEDCFSLDQVARELKIKLVRA